MALELFQDIFASLNKKDRYLMNENEYPGAEKEFDKVSFIVNKGFSQREDTIFLAQEMNLCGDNLTAKQKYDFYFYMVPKAQKRWQAWAKKIKTNNVDIIKEYYECSTKKALEYSEILTEEQLDIIRSRLYTGGIEK